MIMKKETVFILYVVSAFESNILWKEGDLNVGYDFESQDEEKNIHVGFKDTLRVPEIQKHGNYSLLWKWKNNDKLHIDLSNQIKQYNTLKKACGIYFWLFQKKSIRGKLKVVLHSPFNETYQFFVNLHFKNWRAVARTFQVSEKKYLNNFYNINFEVDIENGTSPFGNLYFDLIRLSSRCIGWSYDKVNQPQVSLKKGLYNDVGGTENLNGFYEENHFWQSMYKWWQIDKYATSKIDSKTPLSSEEKKLLTELNNVENHVDNWYYPDGKVFSNLDNYSQQKLQSLFQCKEKKTTDIFLNNIQNNKKEIFQSIRTTTFFSKNLQRGACVNSAFDRYVNFSMKRRHLFPSRDIFPYGRDDWSGMKFNEVNHHILFPLTLEYFISKRLHDAVKTSKNINNTTKKTETDILYKNLNITFKYTDKEKISTFTKLFRILEIEGWDEGSSLGNTDHLLNLNEGYTQSVYLIRRELSQNKKFFKRLLKTARWYNEIGELHQKSFPNKGTTADKGKNVLGKLLLILSSPQKTIQEARQKIQDAKRLKAWAENALEINEAYAGIIKPDFTGYHHKGVYMSAYSSEAMHAFSILAYFLRNTSFSISDQSLHHLTKALKTIHLMSNSLTIPLGVSGAKLANSLIMNQLMPAYAYMSLSKSNTSIDKSMASIFLKLYDKKNPFIMYALEKGDIDQPSRYFNSIGSVSIMKNLQQKAILENIRSIKTPRGHWFFSFASLSLHRRKNWSVTVKGFSKYTWDFESLINQNVYGRFLSHGHISIMNGISSLHDNINGWDWNRIPGATTIELELPELISHGESRYFTSKTTVGGSPFGKKKSEHGVFVMDFEQPRYQSTFYKQNPNTFSFKKSFYFIDDIIICLGSNIQQNGIKNRNVITTLFQERLHGGSFIKLNGENCSYPSNHIVNGSAYFLDGQNNGYVIPRTSSNLLHLKIGLNNNTGKRNGEKVSDPKVYASLIIHHGVEPVNASYEYVIQIATNEKRVHLLAETINRVYKVIQKDGVAHIVHFIQSSTTSYVIFDALNFVGNESSDLVYKVNRASIVTVIDEGKFFIISVMDPDLRRFDKHISNSKNMKQKIFYSSRSQPDWLILSLNKQLNYVSAKCPANLKKTITFYNDFILPGSVKPHVKLQLSHGHTCKLKFKKQYL
ncbi:chondroitin sulfate ABC exolyase isoform X2 [Hydra vulgaris]|uniref:Chondroitin sulfate ABC exolyase isoform X2 n=1 Tax=Hydra vulgaris TaxID=6087 RepID=A0ABM4CTH8_HYDVU